MLAGNSNGQKIHRPYNLPRYGFMVSCFPHKIKAASAGWTRAVAIIEELKS
jgi:hypothetical protein